MEKISSAFEKVRNHQAMERMKMLVGMDFDEESAPVPTTSEESSFAFMDDFNRHCTLSTQQRIHGFIICFVAGLTCTFLSMLVFFNPIKFGITFTLGNLLSIGSFPYWPEKTDNNDA